MRSLERSKRSHLRPLRLARLPRRTLSEAQAGPVLAGGKGSPEDAEGAAVAQIADLGEHAQGYGLRVIRRQDGGALVRSARRQGSLMQTGE